MSKLVESLLRGANKALAHARKRKIKVKNYKVKVLKHVDVRSIRLKLDLILEC